MSINELLFEDYKYLVLKCINLGIEELFKVLNIFVMLK